MSEEHIIDCDAKPFVPGTLRLYEEDQLPDRASGLFTWDPMRVSLFYPEIRLEEFEDSWEGSKEQLASLNRSFNDVIKQLAGRKVLPAPVLDHLLANPHLIPESWAFVQVGFYGTIYRSRKFGLRRARTILRYPGHSYWEGGEGFGNPARQDAVAVLED